jgi:hypothetical protein
MIIGIKLKDHVKHLSSGCSGYANKTPCGYMVTFTPGTGVDMVRVDVEDDRITPSFP